MPSPPRFILRRLALSGPEVPVSDVRFVDGVNVVWGGSNAGKSFILTAIDFMFGGGSPLPDSRVMRGYDRVWLTLDLPKTGRVTLRRAVAGGNFGLYDSDVDPGTDRPPDHLLLAEHKTKSRSLSAFLLDELGVRETVIDRTLNAEKSAFTFRHLAAYSLTDETSMMADWAPTRIDDRAGDTFNKNLFKLLLTGIDGSATVTTEKPEIQRRGNAGKLELIDELIGATEEELRRKWPDAADLEDQERRIEAAAGSIGIEVAHSQERLDALRFRRREVMTETAMLQAGRSEILQTLDRFGLLATVYDSDVDRLASLAEGGAALLAGTRRSCPVCGADPEHQREGHGLAEIESTQAAAEAEIAKVLVERADLVRAVETLTQKAKDLFRSIANLMVELDALDNAIVEERPRESSVRRAYEDLDQARQRVRQAMALQSRIEELTARRREIEAFKPTILPRGSVVAGVDGAIGDEFARDVESVMEAWRFPGPPRITFDLGSHDIRLNGDSRRGNGKGVRALMHAAFKIAVLVYCRRHGRPHPGIIGLDSPLLSYRDALTSRHGALSPDEEAVKRTGLNTHFYEYLRHGLANVQYLVFENDPPPFDLGSDAGITVFTGPNGEGARQGFFLPK